MGGALRALAAGPPLLFARLHPFLPKLSAPAVIPSERARACSGLGYGNVRDSCAGRWRVRRGTAPPAALKALQPVDLTTTRTPSLYHDERVRMQQREPPRLRVRPSPSAIGVGIRVARERRAVSSNLRRRCVIVGGAR